MSLPAGYVWCPCDRGAAKAPDGRCPACNAPIASWPSPKAPRGAVEFLSPIEPWTRTFVVEYDLALSKNRRTGCRDGTRYTPKATKEAREELEFELRIHLRGAPIVKGRLHLDLLGIWCDGRRRDIINVADEVADCVSRITGVDDRWFSLAADWKLDPDAPSNRVRVTVSQG